MGYRYGISDINGISIWDIGHQWDIDRGIDMRYGLSIWDMIYRYGHTPNRYGHILDIDMGYGLMIWEMTVSILSSWISTWDILSLCYSYTINTIVK